MGEALLRMNRPVHRSKSKARASRAVALALLLGASAGQAIGQPPGLAPAASAADARSELVLLGTGGGPGGRTDRAGIATLLRVDGQTFLIDAGEGVSRQLAAAGLRETDVATVFLTHLHDDHYAGLGGLATFAYTTRGKGLHLYGPAGVADLRAALVGLLQVSANIRRAENNLAKAPAEFLTASEFAANPVFESGRVRVSAIENQHFRFAPGSPAAGNKSYSLRFDVGDKSIVFTGDTGPDPKVEALAKGADVLVAEMASYRDRQMVPPEVVRHMDEEHLSPTEVGRLATRAGVKTLILSHIGVVGDDDVAEVRRQFQGTLMVGSDLARVPF